MSSSIPRFAIAATAAGLILAGAGPLCAQSAQSAPTRGTDREMELMEAREAAQMLAARMEAVAKRSAELEVANAALAESLAAANAEAEEYRNSYMELRLEMEALGVEALLPDSTGLEQRLLKAVSDIRILEEEKKELAEQLVRLSEATMNFLAAGDSPGAGERSAVEAELERSNGKLDLSANDSGSAVRAIDQAQVVHYKAEYGLVVLDTGTGSGARVGMPVRLLRDDSVVATAIVVDVRSKISGAIVQGFTQKDGEVKIGDRVEVQTQETL